MCGQIEQPSHNNPSVGAAPVHGVGPPLTHKVKLIG